MFNDSTSFLGYSWRAADTLDQLIVQGLMRDIIVVGLYNTPNRMNEYTVRRDRRPRCAPPEFARRRVDSTCTMRAKASAATATSISISSSIAYCRGSSRCLRADACRRAINASRQNLPVKSVPLTAASLGILGSSLGGLISCYAGYTRPHVYAKAGCMSSSFFWADNNFNDSIVCTFSAAIPRPRSFATAQPLIHRR